MTSEIYGLNGQLYDSSRASSSLNVSATEPKVEELQVERGQYRDQKDKLRSKIETPADLKNEWYSKRFSQDLDWGKFLKDVRKELWI